MLCDGTVAVVLNRRAATAALLRDSEWEFTLVDLTGPMDDNDVEANGSLNMSAAPVLPAHPTGGTVDTGQSILAARSRRLSSLKNGADHGQYLPLQHYPPLSYSELTCISRVSVDTLVFAFSNRIGLLRIDAKGKAGSHPSTPQQIRRTSSIPPPKLLSGFAAGAQPDSQTATRRKMD
jgi:hypothetical protein